MSLSQPTDRSAWCAVGSIAAATFLLVTTEFLPVGLLGDIAAAMRVSEGRAGLSITIPGMIAAIAAPTVVALAWRIDRRLILWLLTAIIIASNLIVAFADSFTTFLCGRLLLGIGVGGLWAVGMQAGRRLVADADGARATAIISAGIGAGTVVGVPAGTLIGGILGWRSAFEATAACGLIVLLAQFVLLPNLPSLGRVGVSQFRAVLLVPLARAGLFGITILACGHFLSYTYLQVFLSNIAKIDGNGQAMALSIFAVTGLLGGFATERLARFNHERAMLLLCLIQASAIVLLAVSGNVALLALLWIALWGLVFGGVPVASQIWMFQAAPEFYEGGAALMVTFLQIGLGAGAFVGGVLLDHYGVVTAYAIGAGISAVAVAMFGIELTRGRRSITATALD